MILEKIEEIPLDQEKIRNMPGITVYIMKPGDTLWNIAKKFYTTVEEIIEASGTSRGSFYHYFEGKDALLSSVSFLFDEKYEELMARMDPEKDRFEVLMELNRELFAMIENSISLDLLARLYSSQLVTRGDKHLLDHNRTYYKLLRQIVLAGAAAGRAEGDVTVNEMVRVYALCERALIYDWCLSWGD